MKELIGIVLFGLFGFALWKTRQVATTAPRCPTLDELGAINDDILGGKTDLADAENLAKSYDAIPGCDAASTSIRATILAKKSAGVSTEAPPLIYKVAPGLVAKTPPVDPGILLAVPGLGESVDPLSVEALPGSIRTDVQRLLATPRGEWTATDLAIYGALTGVGKPPSPGCEGLQEGQILDDWFSRKVYVCNPSLDEWKAGVRKTVLAEHPDNALSLLFAHAGGA